MDLSQTIASEISPPCSEMKTEKAKVADNDKNRCAYISKQVVKLFLSLKFKKLVTRLCKHNKCSYSQVTSYYQDRIKDVFGTNHLIQLLTPENNEEIAIKRVFRVFMRWFLRERYVVYLMKKGRMGDKESYIDYKNKSLLYME